MLRKSQLLSAAQIEAQLRAQVGDATFDAIPNAAPARTEPQPRLPRPKRCRSPQKQASIERRRRMVGTVAMPPSLAAKFTWGEQSYLRVVAEQIKTKGYCDLHVDAIAAMAGVRRTTGQNAQRRARRLGLVTVEERRVPGRRKNLPNIIRIVSPEWMLWIKRGPSAWRGVFECGSNKKLSTTDTSKKEEATGKIEPAGPGNPLENVLQSWGRVVDDRRST